MRAGAACYGILWQKVKLKLPILSLSFVGIQNIEKLSDLGADIRLIED
ncbi:MAG: hypothetical protein ACLS8J_02425 [Streptococcus salivarius]